MGPYLQNRATWVRFHCFYDHRTAQHGFIQKITLADEYFYRVRLLHTLPIIGIEKCLLRTGWGRFSTFQIGNVFKTLFLTIQGEHKKQIALPYMIVIQ